MPLLNEFFEKRKTFSLLFYFSVRFVFQIFYQITILIQSIYFLINLEMRLKKFQISFRLIVQITYLK